MVSMLLRLLGVGSLWSAMQRGESEGQAAGPVVKLPTGVFDMFVGFRRRRE